MVHLRLSECGSVFFALKYRLSSMIIRIYLLRTDITVLYCISASGLYLNKTVTLWQQKPLNEWILQSQQNEWKITVKGSYLYSLDQLLVEHSFLFAAKLHTVPGCTCWIIFHSFCAVIWACALLSPPSSGRAPPGFYLNPDCFGKGTMCFCELLYRNSNFNFHCADAEEVWPAVSAFPWAKLLCRCPLKHGDENRKLLWSKPSLWYFSRCWGPYGTCAVCQSLLQRRWMHFYIRHGLMRQAPLAECVPPTINSHIDVFSFIAVWGRTIGTAFTSL